MNRNRAMWRSKRLWTVLVVLALAAISGNLTSDVVQRVVASAVVG